MYVCIYRTIALIYTLNAYVCVFACVCMYVYIYIYNTCIKTQFLDTTLQKYLFIYWITCTGYGGENVWASAV